MQTEQRRRMEISSLLTAIHVHNRHARRLSNIRIDITRYAMRDLDTKSSPRPTLVLDRSNSRSQALQ